MGTNVASGTAQALVVYTGDKTYFGSLSKAIAANELKPVLIKELNSVSLSSYPLHGSDGAACILLLMVLQKAIG